MLQLPLLKKASNNTTVRREAGSMFGKSPFRVALRVPTCKHVHLGVSACRTDCSGLEQYSVTGPPTNPPTHSRFFWTECR